jgi:hypothetical protein
MVCSRATGVGWQSKVIYVFAYRAVGKDGVCWASEHTVQYIPTPHMAIAVHMLGRVNADVVQQVNT